MAAEFYENRSLFSDYYLENRLPDLPELSEAFETLLKISQAQQAILPCLNESKTEEKFIKPVLKHVLGDC